MRRRVAALEAALAERPQCPDPDAWRRPASWAGLRRGMSRFDVYTVLGEPGRTSRYEGFERWEYPDLLGGQVNFDAYGRVAGWRAPQR